MMQWENYAIYIFYMHFLVMKTHLLVQIIIYSIFYYFCSSTVSSLVSFLANGLCLAKSSMYCPKIAFSCRSLKNQVSKYFKKNEIRFYYLKKNFLIPKKYLFHFFKIFIIAIIRAEMISQRHLAVKNIFETWSTGIFICYSLDATREVF